MSEHLSTQLIERYCQRAISAAEVMNIDAHLTGCEECRKRLGERKQLGTTYHALLDNLRAAVDEEEEDHLSDGQLSAYVAGELSVNEHRQVEAHLKACSSCAWEANELREYTATLPPYKTYQPPLSTWEKLQARWRTAESAETAQRVWREAEPVSRSAAPAPAPMAASAPRPVPARRGFSFRPLLAVAAALATIVVIAGISWQLLRPTQSTQIAQQPPPATIQPQVTPNPTLGATPETSPTTAAHSSPVFAVFLSSLARGSGEKVEKFDLRLEPDATEAQIRIDKIATADPSGEKYESYTATLETKDGRVIWRQAKLKARAGKFGSSVSLKVPTDKLNNGEYMLSLYGIMAQGDERRVGDCTLNVTKMK